jgi:hypothetical protein
MSGNVSIFRLKVEEWDKKITKITKKIKIVSSIWILP